MLKLYTSYILYITAIIIIFEQLYRLTKTTIKYQKNFQEISSKLSSNLDINEWYEIHKILIYWQKEIENASENNIDMILKMQQSEANSLFFKFGLFFFN